MSHAPSPLQRDCACSGSCCRGAKTARHRADSCLYSPMAICVAVVLLLPFDMRSLCRGVCSTTGHTTQDNRQQGCSTRTAHIQVRGIPQECGAASKTWQLLTARSCTTSHDACTSRLHQEPGLQQLYVWAPHTQMLPMGLDVTRQHTTAAAGYTIKQVLPAAQSCKHSSQLFLHSSIADRPQENVPTANPAAELSGWPVVHHTQIPKKKRMLTTCRLSLTVPAACIHDHTLQLAQPHFAGHGRATAAANTAAVPALGCRLLHLPELIW